MATRKNKTDTPEIETQHLPEQQTDFTMQIPPITARVYPIANAKGNLLAIADVNIGKLFAVKDFKIYDSKSGPFVKPPAAHYFKGNTRVEKDLFFPITKESREALYNTILNAYHQEIQEHTGEMEWAEQDGGDLPFPEAPLPDESEEPGYSMNM